jgi:protoporphyrin/coproporphyrin ferrochelatase
VKSGVLLINLGTLSAPTPKATRSYLAEFLSDRRVVELPRWLWQPLLKLVILPIRARHSSKLYQSIWMEKGSPLSMYTQHLAEKVQANLSDHFKLVLAMRYGKPSIQAGLKQLLTARVSSITILPLYPQYSATTTASCFDKITEILRTSRVIPNLHFIASYFDHPLYIAALANQIKKHRVEPVKNSYLLFSFHSLPQRCIKLGDPYQQQCFTTARLLAERLQLAVGDYQVVFQSRFGIAEWLQPYCDVVLQQLPARGIKNVSIICPGFAVDCLETLEEIAKRYRKLFLEAGGESFTYIPALNDSEEHSQLITHIIQA